MQVDSILKIAIDDAGRLCVTPAAASFPQIYREAKEVHWDSEKCYLYTPKPREWSYLDWFRQIVVTAKEQSYHLTITSATQWVNISDDLKAEITNWGLKDG